MQALCTTHKISSEGKVTDSTEVWNVGQAGTILNNHNNNNNKKKRQTELYLHCPLNCSWARHLDIIIIAEQHKLIQQVANTHTHSQSSVTTTHMNAAYYVTPLNHRIHSKSNV